MCEAVLLPLPVRREESREDIRRVRTGSGNGCQEGRRGSCQPREDETGSMQIGCDVAARGCPARRAKQEHRLVGCGQNVGCWISPSRTKLEAASWIRNENKTTKKKTRSPLGNGHSLRCKRRSSWPDAASRRPSRTCARSWKSILSWSSSTVIWPCVRN